MRVLVWTALCSLLPGVASATEKLPQEALPSLATGIFEVPRDAGVDSRWSRDTPADVIVLSGGGNLISFCPQLSCVRQPTPDHQRTSALFAATTRDDGHSEEQTVAIETTVKTGAARRWAPRTRYNVGDNVTFSDARNSVYRVTMAGISATNGVGPTGKAVDIVDGSVHWRWINDAAIDAKVGLYNELATYANGGASWGQANNVHLQPGATPTFNVNTELDFSNDAADCVFAIANCINLEVSSGGTHQSTTGLYIVSNNVSSYATHWGLRLAGDRLASDEDIEDDAEGPVGIGIGLHGGKHATAAVQDGSAGAVSYLVTGNHTVASYEDRSNSPASLSIGGHHAIAGIVEQSTSLNGIALNGNYTGAQLVGKGIVIEPSGALRSVSLTASGKLSMPFASVKSSQPCEKGQAEFDENYLYLCIKTNTWKRLASTSF